MNEHTTITLLINDITNAQNKYPLTPKPPLIHITKENEHITNCATNKGIVTISINTPISTKLDLIT